MGEQELSLYILPSDEPTGGPARCNPSWVDSEIRSSGGLRPTQTMTGSRPHSVPASWDEVYVHDNE